MTQLQARRRIPLNDDSATVTPLELFFDLVFVFALTQVTALMAADLSASGLVRGLLIIGLLWWSWTGYAWLSNVARADAGSVRFVMFLAMAAMFVLALGIPEAFDDMPGGLNGPLVVAGCYFGFRLAHLGMFWLISSDDPGLHRQLIRWAPSVLGGTLLLIAAAGLDGRAQTLMWAAALTADYVGTLLAGADGWRIRSTRHFAERHGLIIIVALGESIVAIGVGVAELPITGPIVLASCVGLTVSAAMWWAYFDISARHAEHAFAAEPADTQARFARDAYSFLHVPLIAGIVLTALGMKKVLEYVSDTEHHDLSDALPTVAVVALFGGVLLYLLGHVAFKWRTGHAVMPSRVAAAGLILLLGFFGPVMSALAALSSIAAVLVAMVAFETFRYAEHRAELHGW